MRVCHFTSVHPWRDTRVFRQCRSLAIAGFDVTLVVSGEAPRESQGVRLIAITPTRPGRWYRVVIQCGRVTRAAYAVDADVYHFHDPELLPWSLILRLLGKRVVYDVHEDYKEELLLRPYLWPAARRAVARMVGWLERAAAPRLSAIVAATDHIKRQLDGLGTPCVAIHNYPNVDEFGTAEAAPEPDENRHAVCYVGNITISRGVLEMVRAAGLAEVDLELVGRFESEEQKTRAAAEPAWARVIERGFVARDALAPIFARSFAGIIVLQRVPNLVVAEPLKLFEYMAAGLPVVASAFPLWKRIVEGVGCGICVEPDNPSEIAEAIRWLRNHPAEARAMGERGRQAIRERFNWIVEARALQELYLNLSKLASR